MSDLVAEIERTELFKRMKYDNSYCLNGIAYNEATDMYYFFFF